MSASIRHCVSGFAHGVEPAFVDAIEIVIAAGTQLYCRSLPCVLCTDYRYRSVGALTRRIRLYTLEWESYIVSSILCLAGALSRHIVLHSWLTGFVDRTQLRCHCVFSIAC